MGTTLPELQTPRFEVDPLPSAPAERPRVTLGPVRPVGPGAGVWQEPAILISAQTRDGPRRWRRVLPRSAEGGDTVVVGNHVQADLEIADPAAGARHLVLRREGDLWTAEPGRSWLVVSHNSRVLTGPRRLTHGDVLELGRTRLRFFCYRQVLRRDCGIDRIVEEPDVEPPHPVREAVDAVLRKLVRPTSKAVRAAAINLQRRSRSRWDAGRAAGGVARDEPEDGSIDDAPPPSVEPEATTPVAAAESGRGRRGGREGRAAARGINVLVIVAAVAAVLVILAVLGMLGYLIWVETGGLA